MKWVKVFVGFCVFAMGANLAFAASQSMSHLWLFIPAFFLLAVGAGMSAYYVARLRSRYRTQTDEEILHQAHLDAKKAKEYDVKK